MNIKLDRCYHDNTFYYILYKGTAIGEIVMIKKNNMMFIYNFSIYRQYRYQGYGTKTLKVIIDTFNIKAIVGECLEGTSHFWSKMIKLFDGARKNYRYCTNCTSSFILPKVPGTANQLFKSNNDFKEYLSMIYTLEVA